MPDVGHDERTVPADVDDAEVGRQGRERIVGDERPGRRDARDQGGLPGVGEADQADVGDELQLEDELLLLAGPAGLRFARRLVRRRGVGRVAPAALAALGRDAFLAVGDEVEEHAARVFDDRPDRDAKADVGAALPISVVRRARRSWP